MLIVKVQMPLMTNGVKPMAFIYNEDKSFKVMIPVNYNLRAKMGGKTKKYFYAEIQNPIGQSFFNKNSNINLLEEAEDQSW